MLTNIKDAGDHVILEWCKNVDQQCAFCTGSCGMGKNEQDEIQGVIVERGMEGFTTPTTHGKWSLRASATGELVFDNVKVPKENILPNVKGLKGPLGLFTKARYGIAWGAWVRRWIAMILLCNTAKERVQFGRPIGGFQLQQKSWLKW
jgi:glutaryl-CoA dehydrogenase